MPSILRALSLVAATCALLSLSVVCAHGHDHGGDDLTHEFVLGGASQRDILQIIRPTCRDHYIAEDGSVRVSGS